MTTKFWWELGWLGEVELAVSDERVGEYAEALDELGFGDARMEKMTDE